MSPHATGDAKWRVAARRVRKINSLDVMEYTNSTAISTEAAYTPGHLAAWCKMCAMSARVSCVCVRGFSRAFADASRGTHMLTVYRLYLLIRLRSRQRRSYGREPSAIPRSMFGRMQQSPRYKGGVLLSGPIEAHLVYAAYLWALTLPQTGLVPLSVLSTPSYTPPHVTILRWVCLPN